MKYTYVKIKPTHLQLRTACILKCRKSKHTYSIFVCICRPQRFSSKIVLLWKSIGSVCFSFVSSLMEAHAATCSVETTIPKGNRLRFSARCEPGPGVEQVKAQNWILCLPGPPTSHVTWLCNQSLQLENLVLLYCDIIANAIVQPYWVSSTFP